LSLNAGLACRLSTGMSRWQGWGVSRRALFSRTIHTMPELRAVRQMPRGTDRLFAHAPIAALLAHEQMQAAPAIGRVFRHAFLFLRPCTNNARLLPGFSTP